MILLVDKIEKSFGARVLFSGASFQINPGERFALVGPNGAGKTTMLKIIMGIDSPDAGQVQYAKDCQVGYLEQETNLEQKDTTILAEVMAAAKEIRRMGKRANELQAQITELSEQGKDVDALLNEYGQVQDRFEHLGGYELESNARKILSGLGFKVTDFERPCSEFSGGWQMRIALAKLFLRHPDLLLLDEPTNHLDLESVQWLRGFIANYDGAVLIVSHDRAFMDACVDHVAALENRRVTTYTGNYSSYLKQREDNLEQMRAKRAAQERDIAHMQVFVDKFRYKPTKAAQAQERIRKIEQIKKELVILPEGHKHIDFKFPDPPRSGDMVVSLEGVSKSYGDKHIYSDIDLKLYRGEHVALVGPNGAGKSTLMKIIAGLEPPTTGTRDLGTNVGVRLLRPARARGHDRVQHRPARDRHRHAQVDRPQQRSLLGAFLFSDNDSIEKQVRVLSGGEKARLALAKMLVAPEALLCLDEPTNHLDIDSVDMLENARAKLPRHHRADQPRRAPGARRGQPRHRHPRRQGHGLRRRLRLLPLQARGPRCPRRRRGSRGERTCRGQVHQSQRRPGQQPSRGSQACRGQKDQGAKARRGPGPCRAQQKAQGRAQPAQEDRDRAGQKACPL